MSSSFTTKSAVVSSAVIYSNTVYSISEEDYWIRILSQLYMDILTKMVSVEFFLSFFLLSNE